jgi:lysozyme family protein
MVRAEINGIVLFFSYMQNKALLQGEDLEVVFDIEKGSYYERNVQANHVHFLHQDIKIHILPGVKGPPSSPQAIVQKPITFVGNTVIFYKTGIVSSGVIYIADTKNNVQYAISNAVSSISCIRLYQYTKDEKWVLV